MIKSKKLISLLVSAAMLITMLASFTMVASADEAAPAYTTHAWYTFEDGTLPAEVTANTGDSAVDLTVDGKYGKGVKISKRTDKLSEKKYPTLKVEMENAIAIANGTTVEVEFDFYQNIPKDVDSSGNDATNYLYIYFADSAADDYKATGNGYVRLKDNGEVKIYHLANSKDPNPITLSDYKVVNGFYKIKLVLEGSVEGDTKGWILKQATVNGSSAGSSGKLNQTFSTVDFKVLGFYTKMIADKNGDYGVDNISITSYSTPSNGKSPVPDRHKFMDKVLTYTGKVGTDAYNSALALFEKSYVTAGEFSDAIYELESNSTLFTITNIAKENNSISYTSTDTTGGTPILVVGAYDKDYNKLYAAQCIKLSGFKIDGTENKVTYNLGDLPEEATYRKAFIFSSLDSLVPLAVSYDE